MCFALGDDTRKRRYILGNDRAGSHIGISSEAAKLMHRTESSDDHEILHGYVTRQRRPVREDRVAAHHAIVGYMRIGHKQIIVADSGDAATLRGAAAYGTELA